MNILVVNTAGERVELALKAGERTAYYINEKKEMASVVLLSEIEKLLESLSVSLKDIDYFGCVIGPGSFTGIRIGVSTVRGFCHALNKQAVAVNRLELLAYNNKNYIFAPNSNLDSNSTTSHTNTDLKKDADRCIDLNSTGLSEYTISVVDGQNGVCYISVYSADAKTQMLDASAIRTVDLKKFLDEIDEPFSIVTDYDLVDVGYNVRQIPFLHKSLLSFTEQKILNGELVGHQGLEPLYIRKAQAERRAGEL